MMVRRDRYMTALDWLLVILTSVIALLLLNVSPDHHSFSLLDLDISFGHRAQPKVDLVLLIFLSVVVPFLIITFLSLYPFRFVTRSGRDQAFSAQFRNLNAGLLGLGVSLATTTVALNIKNLAGRPRPDFLERCQPDVENIAAYAVGASYGRSVSELWVMVAREICQADWREVNEGFRSFPCGYAMVAFAGLWYLTLFMSAKVRIIERYKASMSSGPAERDDHRLSNDTEDASVLDEFLQPRSSLTTSEEVSAAPPTYFLILPYLSFGLAIFIAGTRYFDFRNHGSDVFAGAAGGTASGSFAFWVYGRHAFPTHRGREA